MTLHRPLSLNHSTTASFPGTNVPVSAGGCNLPGVGCRTWSQVTHRHTVYLLDLPTWPGKVRPQALCSLTESNLEGVCRSAVGGQRHPAL